MDSDRDLAELVELNDRLLTTGYDVLSVYREWVKAMASLQLGAFVRRHGREALEERAAALRRSCEHPVSERSGDSAGEWWLVNVVRPLQVTATVGWDLVTAFDAEPNPVLFAVALLFDHLAQVAEGGQTPLFRAPLAQAGYGATLQQIATTSIALAVSAAMVKLLAPTAPVADPDRRDDEPPFGLGNWEGNTLW